VSGFLEELVAGGPRRPLLLSIYEADVVASALDYAVEEMATRPLGGWQGEGEDTRTPEQFAADVDADRAAILDHDDLRGRIRQWMVAAPDGRRERPFDWYFDAPEIPEEDRVWWRERTTLADDAWGIAAYVAVLLALWTTAGWFAIAPAIVACSLATTASRKARTRKPRPKHGAR
jgi:hypothetical protein